tara:strand:+ start:838 stop:1155 length:318 start_codon:yes stop_codon:yes gene_type:complete
MINKLIVNIISAMSLYTFVVLFSSDFFLQRLDQLLTVSAWVTKSDITAGQIITPDLLTETRIEPNQIYGSIQNLDTLVGQTLTVHKQAGSAIYLNEVATIDGITQ